MNASKMNSKHLCYLTAKANAALEEMRAAGLDEDVAVALLEQLLPEQEIYELEALSEDDGQH